MKALSPFAQNDESINNILEIATAFQKSKVLLTACELDLFTIIGDTHKTAQDISYLQNTNKEATERLLNALCALGLLEKVNDMFFNTQATRNTLVKGKPAYIGNMSHLAFMWKSWSDLTESVRKGTSVIIDNVDFHTPLRTEAFIEAMHWRAMLQAPEVIATLDLENVKNVLDVGAGSGAFSLEFLKAKDDIEVTVFDFPNIIPMTLSFMQKEGLNKPIKTMEGNFIDDSFGKGYDLIFMSMVMHSYSIWDCINLARKAYDALNKGGRLVIHETVISDDRTQPLSTALFALNMLVNTKEGNTLTDTDIWIVLKESWFTDIERHDTKFNTSVIIGKK